MFVLYAVRYPLYEMIHVKNKHLAIAMNYQQRTMDCVMNNELRTNNYQLNTSDERSIFMQNEPNFRKSQMNVNKVLTKDYEKKTLGGVGKNKAKQTQTKPNSKRPK